MIATLKAQPVLFEGQPYAAALEGVGESFDGVRLVRAANHCSAPDALSKQAAQLILVQVQLSQ